MSPRRASTTAVLPSYLGVVGTLHAGDGSALRVIERDTQLVGGHGRQPAVHDGYIRVVSWLPEQASRPEAVLFDTFSDVSRFFSQYRYSSRAQLDISSDARGFFIKVTIRSRGLLRKLTCLSWVSVSLKYVRAGKRDKSTEVTGLCSSSPSSRSRVNRSMPQVLATPLQKMLRTSSTEMMPKPSVPDAVKVTV